MELLANPGIAPFAVALVLAGAVLVVEVCSLLFAGTTVSDALSAALDIDGDAPVPALDWLQVRGVPVLVILASGLTGFALGGLLLQTGAYAFTGQGAPAGFALTAGGAGAVAVTKLVGVALRRLRVMHTTAVSGTTFVGMEATMLSPVARRAFAGEARLKDIHGQPHYIQVEPEADGDEFAEGDVLVITARRGTAFVARRK